MDISVFSLDDSEGVDVGLFDGDNSLSAVALLEAVSVILFSASVEAFNVTSEFLGNLTSSLSEVGLHSGLSGFVLLLGNLEFFTGFLPKGLISVFEVSDIGLVVVSKSLLLGLWKVVKFGGATSFFRNALEHLFVHALIWTSTFHGWWSSAFWADKEVVDTLSGNFFVASTFDGELIEEGNVVFSDWFHVFTEDNVFSNFVGSVSVGKRFKGSLTISLIGGLSSLSVLCDIVLDGVNFINVPGNGWEGDLSGGDSSGECDGSEFHILKNWFI